ncbi:hypothetical protein CDL12_23037 [Handroanthus impetiginosus]|uniref:Pectinesterase inhibitor domain-containing protein n=1 Tax=Handroanthus impetiginosus TaxID=429701 RepID=A0A2G9GGL1_9LAMI|nr:hypothetical protein CDL12_23037 [Handroanthus impetiginosus]
MKDSTMLCKLFFLLALLFGLGLSSAAAAVPLPRLQLRRNHKITELSNDPLIKAACRGVGDHESECISTLQSAPQHQKADADGLAFFTLRYVEDHAVNLTVDIKKIIQGPDVAPLLQSALSDCMDQYNPLDDLIEDAINALLAKAYSDAKKFVDAAISNIDECDKEFKASNLQEKAENKTGDNDVYVNFMKEYNVFLKNMLSAALSILKKIN